MLLKARPSDDLDWVIEKKPEIFEFDLGLSAPYYPIDDQLEFSARARALKHFTESVWPKYPNTEGILYRGSVDFSEYFLWNEKQESQLMEFSKDLPEMNELHQKRLFCASVFVYYFQMLAHNLPDEMSLKLVLDLSISGSLAEKYHLLFPMRFEHFELEHKLLSSSNVGVLFPRDEMCSKEVLIKLDHLLHQLDRPRVVYELSLTEEWEGLDELLVLPGILSEQGKRGVMGFVAAGGEVKEISG